MERKIKCITIGSGLDNDIIFNYPDVDCLHCRIEMVGEEKFRITDMNSIAGTFVNGKRVEDSMLMGTYDNVQVGTHDVSWVHQFADTGFSINIPCGGLVGDRLQSQMEVNNVDDKEDLFKRKRRDLTMRGLIETPIPLQSTSQPKVTIVNTEEDTRTTDDEIKKNRPDCILLDNCLTINERRNLRLILEELTDRIKAIDDTATLDEFRHCVSRELLRTRLKYC